MLSDMRRPYVARFGFVLAVFLFSSGPATADVVHLEDGGRIEGEARRAGDEVVVFVDGGQLRFAASEVTRIESVRSPLIELRARRERLPERAVKPRLQLAAWARQRLLGAEARSLYREVLRLDPDNATARRELEREAPKPNAVPSPVEPSLQQLVAERQVREAEAEVRAARRAVLDAERRALAAEAEAARARAEAQPWPLSWAFGRFHAAGQPRISYLNRPHILPFGLRSRLLRQGAPTRVARPWPVP